MKPNTDTLLLRHGLQLLSLVCLLVTPAANADNNVFDHIETAQVNGRQRIIIQFNTPITYLRHFPVSQGKEIDIRLTIPVLPGQTIDSTPLSSEVLNWKPDDQVPLKSAIIDRTPPSGPELTLSFTRNVSYTVRPGDDGRSLYIDLIASTRSPAAPGTSSPDASAPGKTVDTGVIPDMPAETTGPAVTPAPVPAASGATVPTVKAAPEQGKRKAADEQQVKAYTYALNLASHSPDTPIRFPDANRYSPWLIFTHNATIKDSEWIRLRLGFFTSLEEAQAARNKVAREYPGAWVDRVRSEEIPIVRNWLSGKTTTVARKPAAAPVKPALPVLAVTPASPPRLKQLGTASEAKLRDLYQRARNAFLSKDYKTSIRLLTKLLRYPEHRYSRDAQELIGLARDKNGQRAHAKSEYKKYLKLYPEGEGTERVKQRLDALVTARRAPVASTSRGRKSRKKAEPQWQVFGNLLQFYQRNVTTSDPDNPVTTNSTLDTDLNVNARLRTGRYNVRTQFSTSYTYDFNDSDEGNEYRISDMYISASDKITGLSTRLGRQSSSTGGVQGRFDGAEFGYRLNPKWKVNLVAGYPVVLAQSNAVETDKLFYGINVDGGRFADYWEFNAYAIHQEAYDLTDRDAVGLELRYLHPKHSIFTLLDYDIEYGDLNTALIIGNWRFDNGANINMQADYRNSPLLTTSNALIGQTDGTLEILQGRLSEDQIQQLARDRTARFKSLLVSASKPIHALFTVGGEFSVSNFSDMPASGGVEAIAGTGNEYSIAGQLIGSNIIKTGDTTILELRYNDNSTSDLTRLSLNSRYPWSTTWRLNPKLSIEQRKRDTNTNSLTIKPSLKTEYKFRKHIKFIGEGGYEWSDNENTVGGNTTESSYFLYIGYIADF